MNARIIVTATLLSICATPALAQMTRQGAAMFENADGNGDGLVSREEFLSARAQQFERLDRTSDGFLDDSDMPAFLAKRDGARRGNLRAQLDANKDGRISKEEFVNGPTPIFERADADHNGMLDGKELDAAREMAREQVAAKRER